MSTSLLSVESLRVTFGVPGSESEVVHDVSFHVDAGERVALVGESGSGKSVSAMSVLRLHDPVHTHYGGRVWFQDRDLLALPPRQLRGVRGNEIGMVFQEPMSSLNPVFPVGRQIAETLILHRGMGRQQAHERAIELLDLTGVDHPRARASAFPHMLSGGQRQRATIAIALACDPKLLIADEPTTALDVTIQAQILELLARLQRERDLAIVLISHDMGTVRQFAERAYVMRAGHVVEDGGVERLFQRPNDPYTRELIASRPERLIADHADVRTSETRPPVAALEDVYCHFPVGGGFLRRARASIRAVDGVSLEIGRGETVGVVGESGSGKSTLGRCLLLLERCQGRIEFEGQSLVGLRGKRLRRLRRDVQIVFQDPYGSLSPRMTVENIVDEGLRVHFRALDRDARRARIRQALEEVGLDAAMMWRYPHEFSGGQRQRIAIARALVLEPKLLVLDEPTSALDATVQKQVLALLHGLQQRHGMSYLFISHDLAVVRAVAHRVAVMHQGRIVESGPTARIFDAPEHDYTRRLLGAALSYEAGGLEPTDSL
ncbi:MAG: dipeptide ABC transporter ATP-binding protein [Halofilum sp. (in: g-proteobacteria)]